MLLVSVACLVALGLTLVAVYREQPQSGPVTAAAAARAPLPDADDARVEFPVRPFGYSPAAVDTAYEALRLDYADLLAEAPPDVVERARRRAALRAGAEQPPQDQSRDDQPPRQQPPQDSPPGELPAQQRPASTVIPAQWAGDQSPGAAEKPAGRGRVEPKRVG